MLPILAVAGGGYSVVINHEEQYSIWPVDTKRLEGH
jgi:uncharacterized protein YbdZ (MbtH family)